MALIHQMTDTGAWLFRWRSFLPLLLVLFYLLLVPQHVLPDRVGSLGDGWKLLCLVITLLGLGIRDFTIGFTPAGTSGRNTKVQKANSLNTTGIYSVVRHPLYLGNFFMWMGVVMVTGHSWFVLLTALVFWLYYERIILAEERFLSERFGDVFRNWASRTPAFIPRLSGYVSPSLPFSFRTVLRREYNGMFAVFMLMFVIETAGVFSVGGSLRIDPLSSGVLGLAFAIWLTLRTLKRRTSLLEVEGR